MSIKSVNPKNGEIIQVYDSFSDEKIEQVLSQAAEAFAYNRMRTFSERAQKMNRAAGILEENSERYARLMADEMGKTLGAARAEIKKCALVCRYYAQHAEDLLKDEPASTDYAQAYVRYLPLGVVLAVMPWNFPFWQVFRFAAPSLMAGNAALLKHASNVPACALAIEEVLHAAGFDRHEFQTLMIGSDQVADIIADPRVAAVTLTGSEGAGASVAGQAGKYLKKSVLELGGSDPFIVMPSADLDMAVSLAVKSRVSNCGQVCVAAKRFIVHASVYDVFRERMVDAFQALKIGDPALEDTEIGPMSMPKIRADLDAQVKKSVDMGAKLVCGAEIMEGAGNYYRPGILENIPKDSPAYKDELFGPVASLFRVESLGEALRIANDTRFGLGSAIFSQDEAEIEHAVNALQAGCTFVNALVTSDIHMPFGGVKASGFGRELGAHGIREFCNIKTVCRA